MDPTDLKPLGGWQSDYFAALLHEAGCRDSAELATRVAGVLDDAAVDRLRSLAPSTGPRASDAAPPADYRRSYGVHFTPPALADTLAERAVTPDATGIVADLSCGEGALLKAVLQRAPDTEVRGVEREFVFAVRAAWTIVEIAASPRRHEIVWGDGLELRTEWNGATAVIGNPPYVGEKGNRELFASVRRAHPQLEQWFGPRIDLHYLFLHRGLDLLAEQGRLAYLTSEYWLTATGANLLRADLAERAANFEFERLGAGEFESAPGHHSLIFSARRQMAGRTATDGVSADGSPWHPFATVERTAGPALGELVVDRQGFVSGADRVTRRHQRVLGDAVALDTPVYVWHSAEVDELPARRQALFRPLLRRLDCVPGRIYFEPPGRDFVLWADGTEEGEHREQLEVMLEVFRPLLESRREAERGTMPWYRLWWPRRTEEYARPKLVVPRRATEPQFCLDLSGCHVSSDCTFVLAPDAVADPVDWLTAVMVVANAPEAEAQLRAFGKTKGEILEFYSQPLRDWRLGLRREGERLVPIDDDLAARHLELVDRIRTALETGARS